MIKRQFILFMHSDIPAAMCKVLFATFLMLNELNCIASLWVDLQLYMAVIPFINFCWI